MSRSQLTRQPADCLKIENFNYILIIFLGTRRPAESAETVTSRRPTKTNGLILDLFLSIIS
jgi:hypothetical protein